MTDNTDPDIPPTNRDDLPAGWYVQIDRQYSDLVLAIGPWPDRPTADAAFRDDDLVDHYCQIDCLDADTYEVGDLEAVVEAVIITPDQQPDRAGAPLPH